MRSGLWPMAWDDALRLRADADGLVGFLVALLVSALFIFLAAKLTGEREGFIIALATALVGGFLAGLVLFFIPSLLGAILAIVVWGLVAAGLYRTRWPKGLLIGLVAALLYILTVWIVGLLT